MAEYTIELRHVLERKPNIFDFDYEFYDLRKRTEFERDFIRHFYFREIGVDTIDRFVLNLEDKMKTVFPYYNKLFETAQIEYDILDNYHMKETTTTTRENDSKTKTESYTVGQLLGTQETENKEDRTEDRTETRGGTSSNERLVDETAVTDRKLDVETTENESTTGTVTHVKDGTVTTDQTNLNKLSDTPQGRLDFSGDNAKYLTELKQDEIDGTVTTDESLTDTTDMSKTGGGTNDTTEKTTVKNDGTITDNGSTSEDLSGNVTGNVKTNGTFSEEQKTTSDNNTRMNTETNQLEKIEHERKGNIGIDTDADMLEKHIKFQKVMQSIKRMFFDECEDLFMLVY